jgi:uncharacterized protein (TIGR02001 family)
MNLATKLISALPLVICAAGALAQDKGPEPDYTITYNVGVVSDYRVRGIAQTAYQPALQAGIDFAHLSGFYLGTFASNVGWVKDVNGASKGNLEVDLYGGYKGAINKDMGFDTGIITYQYPGNDSGAAGTKGAGAFGNASTTEIYGALSYQVYNLKYNRSVGNFLGNLGSSGSQYFDLNANFDLGHGFTLTPHIGRQLVPNQTPNANYTDVSLAIAKDFGNGFVATATAMATNTKKEAGSFYRDQFGPGKDLGKSTVVLGVKYSF